MYHIEQETHQSIVLIAYLDFMNQGIATLDNSLKRFDRKNTTSIQKSLVELRLFKSIWEKDPLGFLETLEVCQEAVVVVAVPVRRVPNGGPLVVVQAVDEDEPEKAPGGAGPDEGRKDAQVGLLYARGVERQRLVIRPQYGVDSLNGPVPLQLRVRNIGHLILAQVVANVFVSGRCCPLPEVVPRARIFVLCHAGLVRTDQDRSAVS